VSVSIQSVVKLSPVTVLPRSCLFEYAFPKLASADMDAIVMWWNGSCNGFDHVTVNKLVCGLIPTSHVRVGV
jgi:hypothetical protein